MYPYHYERLVGDMHNKISDWHNETAQVILLKSARAESQKVLNSNRPMRQKVGLLLIQWGGRLSGEQY